MYYSAIGVLAILVLFIVNWDVMHKSKVYDKPAWIVYRRFLFAVVAYYVTDVLWGVLEYYKLSAALFIDTTVYFMAMAVGLYFWAEYTVAYLNEKSTFGRALVYSGRIMVGLIIGMTVVNIFKPVLFTVDDKSAYEALPIRYIMLACQILFLLIISFHSLSSMFRTGFRSDKSKRFRILALFGIIMAVFLFIQLWFPYLPLYSIAYMLGTCLLHSFVANDEKEDYERELQEAERIAELKDRLYAVLENMPGMTFTKDAQTGEYLACNQAFADYAHKDSPEKVVGLTDVQIFDADTASQFAEDDRIALSLSNPYIFYEDVLDANGEPRQLQTTKLKYKDVMGRACVLGMCRDITDLVRVQHEQAITKEAYESAVSTGLMYNNIALTLARDYTEMFYVNTDSEEFTEYRKEEGSDSFSQVRHGWHFFSDCKNELSEGVFPDDKDTFLSAVNRKNLMKVLGSKDTFVLNYRRMICGKPVYFSMKISRMSKDEHFIIIGFMNVDAEMREAMAKNEVLSDALSSAEAVIRNRTKFLDAMSHEIRTPINAIIGLDALALKNKKLDDKSREYLEKIGHNAHSLLSLIDDILDMSCNELPVEHGDKCFGDEENLRVIHSSGSYAVAEKTKARLEDRRILLAEDVQINADIITDMLEMENIKVDHAGNGKIAVDLFENSTAGIYSAILMDVRMPQMDGLEAAKTIRSMDREDAKRIPIIALTDATFGEDVQLSMQAGRDTHLNKPVGTENLIRLLGELIYESEEKLTHFKPLLYPQ